MYKNYHSLLFRFFLSVICVATGLTVFAQNSVGIGTTDPKRLLQIGSRIYPGPAFMRIGAGNGVTQREWELGVNANADDLRDATGQNYDFTIRDATSDTTRLLIDYRNGNVGIGNNEPTEKLEVTGSVKVSQRVEAKRIVGETVEAGQLTTQTMEAAQFKYTSPKSYDMVIPATAFVSCSPGSYRVKVNLENPPPSTRPPTIPPGPTPPPTIPFGVFLEGGTSGQPGYLAAPVSLPQSATITGVTLKAYDFQAANRSTSITLYGLRPKIDRRDFDLALEFDVALEPSPPYFIKSVTKPPES